jgi:two-component system sensor histidine kinase DevS
LSTSTHTAEIRFDQDAASLRRDVLRFASSCGLGLVERVLAALAVGDVANELVSAGVAGLATLRLRSESLPCRIELVVAGDVRALAVGAPPAGSFAGAWQRRLGDPPAVVPEPGSDRALVLSWTIDAAPGEEPADGCWSVGSWSIQPDGQIASFDSLDEEGRLLVRLAGALGTTRAALEDARRANVAMSSELEATNRGIVALHLELERAREAEAELAAIVRFSDDAILSLSGELRVASWNAGAERLLGYSAAEVVGEPASLITRRPGGDGELGDAVRQVAAGDRAARFDTWVRRKDGTMVEAAAAISAVYDPFGRLVGYSLVLSDLTGRRAAEQELAQARAASEVLADRERIARDLHDLVIQRIFASGLMIESALAYTPAGEATSRLHSVVEELDRTISEIRTSIFSLQDTRLKATSVRAQLLDVVARAAASLGFEPHVSFTGAVDTAVHDELAQHLLAVAREALSNVVKHAQASFVELVVRAGPELVLEVTDNGRGLGATTRRSGLANLAERARALGGSFSLERNDGGGSRLVWRVPLEAGQPTPKSV